MKLKPLKRLGAHQFSANTRFDDHSDKEWNSSLYQVVSVRSVLAWFARADRLVGQLVPRLS